jgi:hypothetical protein
MEGAMRTINGAGQVAGRVDFCNHLTASELRSVIDGVRTGELNARRAALLLSPEATEADVAALAGTVEYARAA